jgi:predicted ribosomally synthesized peptide with SipW-like signal peptide
MNKKILLSLSVIGIAAAIAIGGTIAYFSDTETSTGNTFTAGSIDLKVDSTQHYNNMVCVCNTPVCTWQPEAGAVAPFYPAQGTPCGGTWGQPDGKDIVNEKFFNFGDVKPGDSGENTVSLHVVNNDAYIRKALLIQQMELVRVSCKIIFS